MRQIYDFHEAAEQFFGGDAEALRQSVLLGHVRALTEVHGVAHAAPWDEPDDERGRTATCSWRRAVQYDKDDCPAYELHGWFYLTQESVERFIGLEWERMLVTGGMDMPIQETAYFSPERGGKVTLFAPIYTNQIQVLAADMAALGRDAVQAVAEKPLSTRERNNLLRVIRALCQQADIDLVNGKGTAQVAKALELAGFDGPKDKTLRTLLGAARDIA